MKHIKKDSQNPTLKDFNDWIIRHTQNGDIKRWLEGVEFGTSNIQEIWKKLHKDSKSWNSLRTTLLEEQGFLCCYCGCSLNFEEVRNEKAEILVRTVTVEHLKSKEKDDHQKLIFDYENLLACDKNCNQNRGNEELTVNPLEYDSVIQIELKKETEIKAGKETIKRTKTSKSLILLDSQNIDIKKDINTLDLNRADLKIARGRLLDEIESYAVEYYEKYKEDISRIELEGKFCKRLNGKYKAFAFVSDWYITKEY
ncbi:MAG: hypothetical protein EAZ97_09190 [Bacteroidetes bacterium]|nr:MAG: hypothetical protein EAZ97_09190 [Bacteroidota bacterium]